MHFRISWQWFKKFVCLEINTYTKRLAQITWGVLSTKVYPGRCSWNGSQNQPPGITMTPYSVQKTDINMGHFFKIFLTWCENRLNFIHLISKFPKFAWKLKTIFENNVKFLVNFGESLWFWFKNGSHFSAKFGIKMDLLFKSQWHVPTQIILE